MFQKKYHELSDRDGEEVLAVETPVGEKKLGIVLPINLDALLEVTTDDLIGLVHCQEGGEWPLAGEEEWFAMRRVLTGTVQVTP